MFAEILDHLNGRMLFADELAPPLICMIGAHMANLRQYKEPFRYCAGMPEDLRVNVCLVSPSGHAKSHTINQFVHRKYGLIPWETTTMGKITEAHAVGTVKDGEPVRGAFWVYRNGTIAFHEISNLFITSSQQHSGELINQTMEALTEAHVSKGLGGNEPIEYDTYVSLIGGIQPVRFDFSSGMARRFQFETKVWTNEDIRALKLIRRDTRTHMDFGQMRQIKNDISNMAENVQTAEVDFTDSMWDMLDEYTNNHLDQGLMERVLMGKEMLTQGCPDHLVVYDSPDNRAILEMAVFMGDIVAIGTDISLLLSVLIDKPMTTTELWNDFKRFGYSYDKFMKLVKECHQLKLIKQRTFKKTLKWKRAATSDLITRMNRFSYTDTLELMRTGRVKKVSLGGSMERVVKQELAILDANLSAEEIVDGISVKLDI